MGRNSATVKIKGKEDVSKAAGKAGKSIKQLAHEADQANMKTKSAGSQLASFKGGLLAVSAAAVAVGVALKKAFDLAELGAQIKQTKQAFSNMADAVGEDSDEIMRSLMEMTRGTVSEMDLMASASRAAVLGLPVDELDRLMQIAMASSQATGESVTKMFSDIVLGLGRQSKLILDNLGILVNVEQANAKYARSLGKTASELSDADKKQAFFNATLEAGESIVERVGLDMTELTDAQQWQRMRSEVENLKTSLKGMLNSMLTPIVAKIGAALTQMRLAQELADKIRRDMEATTGRNRNILPQPSEIERIRAEIEGMLSGTGGVWGAESPLMAAQGNLSAYQKIVDYLTEIKGEYKDLGITIGGAKAPLQSLLDDYADLLTASEATVKKAREWVLIEQMLADIGAKIPLTVDEQRAALEAQIATLETWVGHWDKSNEHAKELARVIAYLKSQLDGMTESTEKQVSLWAKYGDLIGEIWKSGSGPIDYGAGTWSQGAAEQINTDMSGVVWGAGDMGFGSIMETSVADFFSGGGFDFGAILSDAATEGMPEGMELSEAMQLQVANLTAFGEGLMGATLQSAGFAGQVMQSVMAMGPLGLLFEALKPVIEGIFLILAPAMDGVIAPLMNLLFSFGQIIGMLILPIMEQLGPVVSLLTEIFATVIGPQLELLALPLALVASLLELLQPVLRALAVALEVIMSPIRFLGDLFMWVADHIRTAVHNLVEWIEHPLDKKARDIWEGPGAFVSDAFTGLADRIKEIWEYDAGGGTGSGDYFTGLGDLIGDLGLGTDFTVGDGYDFGGGYGGGPSSHTTVQHAPDVYVTINANAIVGEGGAVQVGEYVAGAIGELIGTGARVEWLEAE